MRSAQGRAALRYALCQIPGLLIASALLAALRAWVDLPLWLVWTLLGIWLIKDLVLFPFLWQAYAPYEGRPPMVGKTGEARERLDPCGYVRIHGELWRAELPPGADPVESGTPVRVRDQRGLTLLVEEVEGPPPGRGGKLG